MTFLPSIHTLCNKGRPRAQHLAWILVVISPVIWADTVKLEITGVDGALRENVRLFLSVAAEHEDDWSASHIQRLHRRARGEIQSALQPFGYYQPKITTALVENDSQWIARYSIEPGLPVLVRSLKLQIEGEGKSEPALERILKASKLASGRQLSHAEYDNTKTALIDTAYNRGYLDAVYSRSEIRVEPEAQRAEITLLLDTGPRYYFGPVSIEQDILNPGFVQRHVSIRTGDPFSTARLNDLQLVLSDTGYFGQVEIEVDRKGIIRASADDSADVKMPQLPINIRTQPGRSQKYTTSAGYGTDTGPRMGAGVELRRLNRRGHKFRTDLQLSEVRQTLSSRYIIPIDNVVSDRLTLGVTANVEEFGDTASESYALFSSREDGWRLGRRRFYLNLERETFDFGGPSHTSDLLYPGFSISLERADDPLRTRRGISLSTDIHGGSDSLLSETDFLQLTVDGAGVLPVGPRGRLLVRGKLGATEAGDFDRLPPSQRFFTGGDRSVRGYAYQSISPTDDDGNETGGRYLAVASIEADYLVYRDYGLALFLDAGDAARDTDFDLKRGAGIGLRWASPIGMVRLDLAHPFDDPDSDFRVHFSLGPDL